MSGDLAETYARLAAALPAERPLELARRLVGVESVTGSEQNIAGSLAALLEQLGASPSVSEFAPGRTNVYGRLPGRDEAPPVLLVAHSDTVRVPDWAGTWGADPRSDPQAAVVVDAALWGSGAADDKGGIAIELAALEALRRAGIEPAGDVLVAFVGDEESGEPGSGRSEGCRALVDAIESGKLARPAFAVYAEPTSLEVYAAQAGFFIAEVTVVGNPSYFAYPWQGRDAVRDASRLLTALYEHEAELSRRPRHALVGSPVLVVTAVHGGESVAVPGRCRIELIRSLLPGEALEEAAGELEQLLHRLSIEHGVASELSFTAPRDHPLGGSPGAVDPGAAAVRLLAASAGLATGRPRIGGAPYWSELPLLAAAGIPGVYFGPGDITDCHTAREHVAVAELAGGARALACFLAAADAGVLEPAAPGEPRRAAP